MLLKPPVFTCLFLGLFLPTIMLSSMDEVSNSKYLIFRILQQLIKLKFCAFNFSHLLSKPKSCALKLKFKLIMNLTYLCYHIHKMKDLCRLDRITLPLEIINAIPSDAKQCPIKLATELKGSSRIGRALVSKINTP